MTRVYLIMMVAALTAGCSSARIHGDKTVVAQGGSRPGWVADTAKQSQKALADFAGHDTDPLTHYYVVSQATVANEQLLPGCYEYARANSANDFARGIAEQVKSTTASASDESSASHYSEIVASTKAKVVGSQVFAKHWESIKEGDQEPKTREPPPAGDGIDCKRQRDIAEKRLAVG